LKLWLGVVDQQLRFFTPEGRLVFTPKEANAKLADKLKELGVDPDTLV